jgi:hypothetical protein
VVLRLGTRGGPRVGVTARFRRRREQSRCR